MAQGCCSGSTCRVSPSTEQTRTRVPGMTTASDRACHVSPRSLTLPRGVQGVTTTAPSPRRVLLPTCSACRCDHQRQYRMVTSSHVIAAAKPTPFHGCGSKRRSTSPTSTASTDSLYPKTTTAGEVLPETRTDSRGLGFGSSQSFRRGCRSAGEKWEGATQLQRRPPTVDDEPVPSGCASPCGFVACEAGGRPPRQDPRHAAGGE